MGQRYELFLVKKTYFAFIFKIIYNPLIYRHLQIKLFFTLCHYLATYVFK